MSDTPSQITELDAIQRERAAFIRGAAYGRWESTGGHDLERAALTRYPDPVRPRVVTYRGSEYRVVDGNIEVRDHGTADWYESAFDSGWGRVLADLFSNPNEPLPEDRES